MAWYVPGTQPGCKPCSVIFKMSLVVIVWPLGSKTRQTSKIRRDSENWVILGHTPKLPKIIDRRNVQVSCFFRFPKSSDASPTARGRSVKTDQSDFCRSLPI